MRFSCCAGQIDFVPPSQSDEATPSDVFEVVEVGSQEEDGEDEDEDEVVYEEEAEEVDEEGCCSVRGMLVGYSASARAGLDESQAQSMRLRCDEGSVTNICEVPRKRVA